ncbi:MAG: DUF5722 domain-containing protein [Lachnospiraceae bacterium]|nr:DUF5722 domain-containing protein [Lachnospiraceae bacterium]
MKKCLVWLLSAALFLGSIATVGADEPAASDTSVPAAYDSRTDGQDRLDESLLSSTALAQMAELSEEPAFEGDRVFMSEEAINGKYLLSAVQKVFVLSREGLIRSSEGFDMTDGDSVNGQPQDRIKRGLLKGRTALLDGDRLIVGWNDDYTDAPVPEAGGLIDTEEEILDLDVAKPRAEETQVADEALQNAAASAPELSSLENGAAKASLDFDTVNSTEENLNTASYENDAVNASPDAATDYVGTENAVGSSDNGIAENNDGSSDKADNDNTVGSTDNSAAENNGGSSDDTATDNATGSFDNADADNTVVSSDNTDTDNTAGSSGNTDTDAAGSLITTEPITKTGAWLVKAIGSDAITYVFYDDEALATAHVELLEKQPETEAVYRYAVDGGIGDGRLDAALLKEMKLMQESDESLPEMASVFTARHDENLTAIGFYTDDEMTSYAFNIYAGESEETVFDQEPLYALPEAGTVTGAGYHTVALSAPLSLKKGDVFAVALTITAKNGSIFYDRFDEARNETGEVIFSSTPSADTTSFLRVDEAFKPLSGVVAGSLRLSAVTDYNGIEEDDLNTAVSSLTDGALYEICAADNQNLALDVQGGNVFVRSNVQLYKANHTNAQQWYAKANSDGTFSFISRSAGRALDVEGNAIKDGTNIQVHTARYKAGQKWKLVSAGNNSFSLVHAYSGKYLTVNGAMAKGTNVVLATKNNSSAQRFVFNAVTPVNMAGTYMMGTPLSKNHVVTAKSPAAGYQLSAKTWAATQLFVFTKNSNGFYTITQKGMNGVLTIDGTGASGSPVISSPNRSSDNQLWRVEMQENGSVAIFSKAAPHVCLSLANSQPDKSPSLLVSSWRKADRQYFNLVDPNADQLTGTFVIRSAKYPDRVLDVADGSKNAGANIQSYNDNSSAAQKYKLTKVSMQDPEPIYYIKTNADGMALTVSGSVGQDANVVQDTYKGSDNQKWAVIPNKDGTYTIAAYLNRNYVLDIASGSMAYKQNIRVHKTNSTAAQKWYLADNRVTSCKLTTANQVTISGTGDSEKHGDDGLLYLIAFDPSDYIGDGHVLGSSADGTSFSITSRGLDMPYYINREFFTAVKVDGIYRVCSNGFYITNPEKMASRNTARIKPINKKGLAPDGFNQSRVNEAINTLHAKHVAENFTLDQIVNGSGAQFTYRGVTYNFDGGIVGSIKQRVKEMNAAGVQVTGILYATKNLIATHPSLVTPGGRNAPDSALLVGINGQEAQGRREFEAVCAFLATTFSEADCHIDNWVIGNELNDATHWNYCGELMSAEEYVTMYTQVFRIAYNTMRSIWSNVRVYDSLDHNWRVKAVNNYYLAKTFQDRFASILKEEGDIEWHLAFHPYCSPEQDPRIWVETTYVTHDINTTIQITMMNLETLSNYMTSKYGSQHRIILSETGISARYKDKDYVLEQAAAIAYGYYIAESLPNVDNYIIHHLQDDSGEMAGGWYLGLKDVNGGKRPAYTVFANMDSKANGLAYTEKTSPYNVGKPIIQVVNSKYTSWKQAKHLANLDITKFGDSRY